jgi:branched-chain amino acid transport system substrate-binding protein
MVIGPMNATDLTAEATRIRNANLDIVLMLTSAPAMGGAFARGAELAVLKAPILGSLSIQQKPFVDTAGYAEILGSTAIVALAEALRHIDGPVTGPRIQDPGSRIQDALDHICGFSGTYADGTFCYTKDQHDGFGPDTVDFVKLHNRKWENTKF